MRGFTKKAKAKDTDIVKGRACYVLEDGSVFPSRDINRIIRQQLKTGKPLYLAFNYEHHTAIYKREMIISSGARYGLSRRAQDTTFLLKACHSANTFETEDSAIYYFCERSSSTMHTTNAKTLNDMAFSFQEQVDYVCAHLGSDPWAKVYVSTILLATMNFYLRYEGITENGPFLKAFKESIKEQLLRLPFYEELKKSCLPARVLVERGVVLPKKPGRLAWEKNDLDKWYALLKRWVGFLSSNPSYCRAFDDMLWFFRVCGMIAGVGDKEGKGAAVRRNIYVLAKPLGLRTRILLRLYIITSSMAERFRMWTLRKREKHAGN